MMMLGSSFAWAVFICVQGRVSYEAGSAIGARGEGMIEMALCEAAGTLYVNGRSIMNLKTLKVSKYVG